MPDHATTETSAYCLFDLDPDEESNQISFEAFASLEPTKTAIRGFANEYGWLGVPEMITGGLSGSTLTQGESLSRWQKEIRDMRVHTEVWRLLERNDEKRLGQMVKWDKAAHSVAVEIGQAWTLLTMGPTVDGDGKPVHAFRPDIYALLEKTPAAYAAVKVFLLQQINRRLKDMVSPCLLIDRQRQLGGYLRPHHLLGALWFQFYQTIIGTRLTRLCKYCLRGMQVTEENRTTKSVCPTCAATTANAVKVRKWRRNKNLAAIKKRLARKTLPRDERRQLRAKRKHLENQILEDEKEQGLTH